MFYVPGLRPVFQKLAGRAGWQAIARRSRQLERTRAFSYASYPRIVFQRESREGISSRYNASTTSRNSWEHRIGGQLETSSCHRVYCYCTGDNMSQISAEVQASRCALDKDSTYLQQPSQSPDNVADTYSPLISPSSKDDSVSRFR